MSNKVQNQLGKPRSFRLVLQDELVQRCRTNPGYSLRAFARALQINPASLSRILRGERVISEEMKLRLGARLGLGPKELSEFPESDSAARYNTLSLDAFAAISDWYHYAILELVTVESFEPDFRWIGKALGITVSEARAAVERLERLGLLGADPSGRWIALQGHNTNVGEDLRHAAFRRLQKQVLEQAIRALEETPLERRDQSSMTMAVQSRRLPEAIRRITNFRRELCAFLEEDQTRDQVYQLTISLFPITPDTPERK